MKRNKTKDSALFSAEEALSLSLGELLRKETPVGEKDEKEAERKDKGKGKGKGKETADREDLSINSESLIPSFVQVTLHRRSAGQGGKTVTLVTIKPQQPQAVLEALARTLRRSLGCGSRLEDGPGPGEHRLVLQGDIPDRAEEWFLKKRARKVVRGN